MKLKLVAHTPDVETLIATAMLTTTSGAKPSTIFSRLLKKGEKVGEIVGRVEAQHGSILEHNRLDWIVEATEREVLDVLLDRRFYSVSELGTGRWLMSANVRTVVETISGSEGEFTAALIASLTEVVPNLSGCHRRGRL
ncbi:MAG: FAD-dependent thymidylate synthase [Candidatus Bathyarchaeota archaeon]|nr:MAG: FAD-dependent thymidylate synthase [Candidatus Bathyarchaeota archaeon]